MPDPGEAVAEPAVRPAATAELGVSTSITRARPATAWSPQMQPPAGTAVGVFGQVEGIELAALELARIGAREARRRQSGSGGGVHVRLLPPREPHPPIAATFPGAPPWSFFPLRPRTGSAALRFHPDSAARPARARLDRVPVRRMVRHLPRLPAASFEQVASRTRAAALRPGSTSRPCRHRRRASTVRTFPTLFGGRCRGRALPSVRCCRMPRRCLAHADRCRRPALEPACRADGGGAREETRALYSARAA